MEVSLFNRDFHARGIIRTSCVYIKWRGEDRDGQIDEEKRTKRKGARRGGRVKGSSRKYIRERLKGRTSESRGWPRTRWMPLSTRTRWKGCGRTDGRVVVAGASTLSVQPAALWATTRGRAPPLGCGRSGGRAGRSRWGEGLRGRLLAEGWIGAAPDARNGFSSDRVESANSGIELDALRSSKGFIARRCMRFSAFDLFHSFSLFLSDFLGICIGGIILNRQIDYFRRRIYGIN